MTHTFEIITVLFPRRLILSPIFGSSGFGTSVWQATVKEKVDVIHLEYAKGPVRDDYAAPDDDVKVDIEAASEVRHRK